LEEQSQLLSFTFTIISLKWLSLDSERPFSPDQADPAMAHGAVMGSAEAAAQNGVNAKLPRTASAHFQP
jgi:hypothetical protein